MSPGIWALGDCNGRGAFTHTAYNDYEIVAANLLDGDRRRVSDRIVAYALYTDPPLGRAGMTEAEVRQQRPSRAGRQDRHGGCLPRLREGRDRRFHENPRRCRDRSEILGASFLGTSGDEVIHCVLDIMYAKAPYTVLQRAMHIHPTVAEFIPTILGDLAPLEGQRP